ncbi:hypothetical protein [Methanobrevibacter sp.]|uniref:hypothetical protein n=1 Tax=Methanobrevibacter sp. TaxID=66852 RepID=UPI00388E80EF
MTIMLFILFLIVGAASASENSTDSNDDLEILINNADENDNIQLDEKTYDIVPKEQSNETHILINKSLTFEGINGKTTIDGKNNTLYLDCEEPKKDDGNIIYIGWRDGYNVKDTGKTLAFKDITFKDINMITWHEMVFNNCTFINANYTNYELNNSFDDCIFNNTQLESCVLYGSSVSRGFNISECVFYNSVLKSKSIYTSTYIALIGGSRFEIINYLNLINSKLYDSKMELSSNKIVIAESELKDTDLYFYSNLIGIENCELYNPNIELGMSKMAVDNSTINNSNIQTYAGYFSLGSTVYLKESILNNTNITMLPNSIYSQKSIFTSIDSTIENAEINTTDTIVSLDNSELKNAQMLLFFSDLALNNSTFYDSGSLEDIIKTKNYTEKHFVYEEEPTTVPCLVKTNYTSTNTYLVNSTGKYLINDEDIEIDTLNEIIVSNKKVYNYGDKLIIELKDYKGNPVADETLYILDLHSYDTHEVKTNKKGIATYKLKVTGKRSFDISYKTPGFTYRDIEHGMTVDLKIKKIKTTVKAKKVNNKFKKSKYFKVSVKNKVTKKAISNVKVKIKVYTGKKYKTFTVKTNKKGIAKLNTKSLKIGKHKVAISSGNKNIKISAKSVIKIKK